MKYLYYLLFVTVLISCKSKKNMIDRSKPTYADFRKAQSTFETENGKIK